MSKDTAAGSGTDANEAPEGASVVVERLSVARAWLMAEAAYRAIDEANAQTTQGVRRPRLTSTAWFDLIRKESKHVG